MPHSQHRIARFETQLRRDDLAALMEAWWPRTRSLVETFALTSLVCAFWGFVIFAAMTYGI